MTSLIEQIKQAFAGVSRNGGLTLHQALALDDRRSEPEVARAAAQDADTRWEEISSETLEGAEAALSFFDPPGFRYYLPAYMIAALLGYVDSGVVFFHLTRLPGLSLRQTTPEKIVATYQLTPEQLQAIAAFLRYYIDTNSVSGKADHEAVTKWEEFCQNQL